MQSNIIPPRTIMEVYKNLPEGTLAELINGNLLMSPSPRTGHQEALQEIFLSLALFMKENKNGKVFFAPYDVFLDEHSNAVQPDIVYVLEENTPIIKSDAIHGTPDLIVEVLSPSNREHDLVRKKNLYQKFGVKEYWVVDPESKETTGFFLEGGTYVSLEAQKGKIISRLLKHEFLF